MTKSDISEVIANVLMFFFFCSFLYLFIYDVLFPNHPFDESNFTVKEMEPHLFFGLVFFVCAICRVFFKKKISLFTIVLPVIHLTLSTRHCVKFWPYYTSLFNKGFCTARDLRNIRFVMLFHIVCASFMCIAFIWHRVSQNVCDKRKELRVEST